MPSSVLGVGQRMLRSRQQQPVDLLGTTTPSVRGASGGAHLPTENEDPDGWNSIQIAALQDAVRSVEPSERSFWSKVARKVPGKTGAECQARWELAVPTPKAQRGRPITKTGQKLLGKKQESGEVPATAAMALVNNPRQREVTQQQHVREFAREKQYEELAAERGFILHVSTCRSR